MIQFSKLVLLRILFRIVFHTPLSIPFAESILKFTLELGVSVKFVLIHWLYKGMSENDVFTPRLYIDEQITKLCAAEIPWKSHHQI